MKRSGRTQGQVARDHLRATGEPLHARGREWRGPCPACGGDDRFRVAPPGHFHCRRHPGDPQHFKAMREAPGYRLDKPSSGWREARAGRARRELAPAGDIAGGPVGPKDPDRGRILAESRAAPDSSGGPSSFPARPPSGPANGCPRRSGGTRRGSRPA